MKRRLATTDIVHGINQFGGVTLRGVHGLALARQILEHAVHVAGHTVCFDPGSTPDLVDILTVTTISTVEGATVGAGLGTVVGLLVGYLGPAAAIGAVLGGLFGAARGVDQVHRGWRVRAIRELDGTPCVTITS